MLLKVLNLAVLFIMKILSTLNKMMDRTLLKVTKIPILIRLPMEMMVLMEKVKRLNMTLVMLLQKLVKLNLKLLNQVETLLTMENLLLVLLLDFSNPPKNSKEMKMILRISPKPLMKMKNIVLMLLTNLVKPSNGVCPNWLIVKISKSGKTKCTVTKNSLVPVLLPSIVFLVNSTVTIVLKVISNKNKNS